MASVKRSLASDQRAPDPVVRENVGSPCQIAREGMQQIRIRTFTYFFDMPAKLAASKKNWTGILGASDVHH
jgi:hypothetical protein